MKPTLENPKTPNKFLCEFCDFITSNKKDYNRHILTLKHKNLQNPIKKPKKTPHRLAVYVGKYINIRRHIMRIKRIVIMTF